MTAISRRSFLAAMAAATVARPPRVRAAARSVPQWPSHGYGPEQHRHNPTETDLTPERLDGLALRWTLETGSGITGTPAVLGDRVVVGSWDGKVYALERRSGKVVWTFDAGTRAYPPDRQLGIYASPAIENGTVYVVGDRILALDLENGRLRWERIIGAPGESLEYFWAPPLVHGGRLYAGVSAGSETRTRGRIVCLDARSGNLLWTFFTVAEDVAGGALVAPPSIDVETGTLWAATGNPFHVRPGPLEHSCSLLALDAETGELRWADQVHPHDTENLDLNCPPMLLETGGRRLVVVGGKDGLRAWDRAARVRLWHTQLTPPLVPGAAEALPTNGPEAGPTATDGRLLYFASNNHADGGCLLAALDPATGRQVWLRSLPAFQHAPLSVAGGVVWLGLGDGRLRAWRAADGQPLWDYDAGDPIAGGPAIAGGMVFVGTGAGSFLSGKRLLAFGLPGKV